MADSSKAELNLMILVLDNHEEAFYIRTALPFTPTLRLSSMAKVAN